MIGPFPNCLGTTSVGSLGAGSLAWYITGTFSAIRRWGSFLFEAVCTFVFADKAFNSAFLYSRPRFIISCSNGSCDGIIFSVALLSSQTCRLQSVQALESLGLIVGRALGMNSGPAKCVAAMMSIAKVTYRLLLGCAPKFCSERNTSQSRLCVHIF